MLNVHPIPAFHDNYFWLLQSGNKTSAYIVDPGAAEPVIAALNLHQLTLAGILVTHHHHDHIGGIKTLVERYQVPVYGPKSSKIPQVTHWLADGDLLPLDGITLKVIAVPGHTLDHIAYVYQASLNQAQLADHLTEASNTPTTTMIFCGDTLFAGGCGRIFDGSATLLYDSLMRLANLPEDTLIYCAHEYTQANLGFAAQVEPNNIDLQQRLAKVIKQRHLGLATVPTTLALEKLTNPYLRTHLPSIHSAAEHFCGHTLVTAKEVFTIIRAWKDQYKEA